MTKQTFVQERAAFARKNSPSGPPTVLAVHSGYKKFGPRGDLWIEVCHELVRQTKIAESRWDIARPADRLPLRAVTDATGKLIGLLGTRPGPEWQARNGRTVAEFVTRRREFKLELEAKARQDAGALAALEKILAEQGPEAAREAVRGACSFNTYGDLTHEPRHITNQPLGLGCQVLAGFDKSRHGWSPVKYQRTVGFPALTAAMQAALTAAENKRSEEKADALAAKRAQEKQSRAAFRVEAAAKGFTVAAYELQLKADAAQQQAEAKAKAAEARAVKVAALTAEFGFDMERFVSVAGVLRAAAAEGHEVDVQTARAVRFAADDFSRTYASYCEGFTGVAEFCRIAEKCQDRHENTEYDDLLRAGFDKATAREMIGDFSYNAH